MSYLINILITGQLTPAKKISQALAAEVIEPSIYMLENYRHSLIMNRQSFTNKGYKGINKKNVQCLIIFPTLYSVSLRNFDC